MNQTPSGSERRRHIRIDNIIPVKICSEDGDIVTKTWNISRSGAYCEVNRYLEPMSKLKIHLLVPLKKGGKLATKNISCEGVIVRIEPAPGEKGYYNVAVFFSDISKKDSDLLNQHIASLVDSRMGG